MVCKVSQALKSYGFKQSAAYYSLFSFIQEHVALHVLVYVDDFIIAGSSHYVIVRFKKYLSSCFHMKDPGILKYFLGIEVARSKNGIFLSQTKYALDVLTEAGMLGCKPLDTPMEHNHRLASAEGSSFAHADRYRHLVGRLVYMYVTHPKLSYVVHTLSQFVVAPHVCHQNAALCVLRYLKGNLG